MGSVDDKGCYSTSTNSYNLAFNHRDRAAKKASHGRKAIASRAKPTPSKWDDAQKWLVGLSGVVDHHHHHSKTKPRNSNAEDRRLLAPMPQKGRDSVSSMDGDAGVAVAASAVNQDEGETKKIDCSDLQWRADNSVEYVAAGVRSVSLRDMGTEMTPNASKETSRTGTPLRARSPERESRAVEGSESCSAGVVESSVVAKLSSLENRALAWDEAERTKYMARYKREEVKIQAWENRKTRKAEMQTKRVEVKAERMKTRAQEKLANKTASTRRRAEEKRTAAEARLNERAAKTSERADYVRRSGRMPSSFFSCRLPSLCR